MAAPGPDGSFLYQELPPGCRVRASLPARVGPVAEPVFYFLDGLPGADTAWPTDNSAPELRLLELDDLVVYPRHVVVDPARRAVLPITFKKHRHHRHGGVVHRGAEQYVLRDEAQHLRLPRPVDRPVYLADTEYPGIFGHDLVEVFTAAWAWGLTDGEALLATSTLRRDYLVELLGAVGVPEASILFFTSPLQTPTLLFPDPPVLARRYVHPGAFDLFARAREVLADRALDTPDRVYVSRRRVGGRSLLNEAAVERVAEELGFTVVHPQELTIGEQITVFANASMVMGSGGSAMHNAVFCARDARVLIVSSPSWITVIDSLLDDGAGRLGYVLGTTEEGGPHQRHQGPWHVNPERVRAAARAHFGL